MTASKSRRTMQEISAGGVVYKKIQGRLMIALIARKHRTVLCLPKGKIERGESPREAARREVKEEINIDARIVKKLAAIHYQYERDNAKIYKTVHYFLMRYQKGAIKGQRIETDGARWYAIDAALAAMSFKGEIATVRKAKIALKRLKTND